MSGYARLRNAVATMGDLGRQALAAPKHGIVTSYDPDHYMVKVRLQPEDIETGWLPVWSGWIGDGWGLFMPPTVGDQMNVVFVEGDKQAGMAYGGTFSDADRPLKVQSGELWIVHKSGSFIKLTNDGKIVSKGPWEHDGTFHATGKVTSEADITDHTGADGAGGVSMKQHRDAYNAHHHGGVTTGSGVSGTTDTPAS